MTYFIAEAGVNHDGEPEAAHALIETAAKAGADSVKFQTFNAQALVTPGARKADYQVANTGQGGSQFDMLRRLELPYSAHVDLLAQSNELGIDFLSTPFDERSVDFLVGDLGLKTLKIGSGDLTNAPLIMYAARSGASLIVSSGMATLRDVEEALACIAFALAETRSPDGSREVWEAWTNPSVRNLISDRVSLLHCTSLYPAPPEALNLRAMETLACAFGLPTGYSDHSLGSTASIAAAARGASIIEKHFTLSRERPGPDHKTSLEPDELAALVQAVRDVKIMLGDGRKAPCQAESGTASVARKSVVASREIEAGSTFSADNLAAKRPGDGRRPIEMLDLFGLPALRSYAPDELIE